MSEQAEALKGFFKHATPCSPSIPGRIRESTLKGDDLKAFLKRQEANKKSHSEQLDGLPEQYRAEQIKRRRLRHEGQHNL